MKAKLTVGQKLITRNFGCCWNDRDAVMGTNTPLLMTAMAPTEITITRASQWYVWLTDAHGFTQRVSRQIIERGLMHGHTVKATTYLSGPFELVDANTPYRDAQWVGKRTKEEFESLRFSLASASVA